MNHLGLFEGIGGFSLAARWAGWETVAWCEINPFCQKVLKYHFPRAQGFTDIKQTDFTQYANRIDVLTGGFPCQPFSLSGDLRGTEDNRYLWPEMLRCICEVRPTWVVAENVYGITTGKFNNVFEVVCSQMEAEGYSVLPVIIPASSVGAPHQRDRVWFIAHRNSEGLQVGVQTGVGSVHEQAKPFQGREFTRTFTKADWTEFPTQSPVFIRDDGLSSRLDGITLSKWREESIKSSGNAIVPQVFYQIAKAINECARQ